MTVRNNIPYRVALFSAAALISVVAFGHGNVTPQSVDVSELEPLGEEWVATNPYSGNEAAIEVGSSAYNQNCARCHGLGGVSGGIAPDLRALIPGDEFDDEFYAEKVRNGVVRNGMTYMPAFAEPDGPLSQEALWAIRAYLETLHDTL